MNKHKPTHSSHLERWLTPQMTAMLSEQYSGWTGPPIPIAGVPGHVCMARGGEFVGPIVGGKAAGIIDYTHDRLRRMARGLRRAAGGNVLGAGFASLSDLISEATTGGKAQDLLFNKAATTATTAGNAFVSRNVGTLPAARGVGGASGTGVKTVRTTTGAMLYANPTGGDTAHLTTWTIQANAISSLMLFDCLWDMTYNHATATTTAVDANNRPDRYQSVALAPGNFISNEITTALSATAHNVTVTYVDQDGNAAEAAAAYAAAVSAVAGRTNTPAGSWFVTLNAGDTGARYLTNIAQSTITSVTGVSTFFVGHPLCIAPCPIANVPFVYDGINSAFSLVRIYDDACLSFMTPGIATTGSITYTGLLRLVSG